MVRTLPGGQTLPGVQTAENEACVGWFRCFLGSLWSGCLHLHALTFHICIFLTFLLLHSAPSHGLPPRRPSP